MWINNTWGGGSLANSCTHGVLGPNSQPVWKLRDHEARQGDKLLESSWCGSTEEVHMDRQYK